MQKNVFFISSFFCSFSSAFANNELESKCSLACSCFKSQRNHEIGYYLPLPNLAASKIRWIYQIKYGKFVPGAFIIRIRNKLWIPAHTSRFLEYGLNFKAIHYQLVFVNDSPAVVKPYSKYIQFYCGFQVPYEDSWMEQKIYSFHLNLTLESSFA